MKLGIITAIIGISMFACGGFGLLLLAMIVYG